MANQQWPDNDQNSGLRDPSTSGHGHGLRKISSKLRTL